MIIELDFPEIKVDTDWVRKLDLPKVVGQEIQTTRTRIIANLNKGLDADGNNLREYSKSYAAFKSSTGRSTTPNLNFTGELQRAMQTKNASGKDVAQAELSFSGTHKGGLANSALAQALYKRGFTGWLKFAKEDLNRIQEAVLKKVDQNVKNLIDVK